MFILFLLALFLLVLDVTGRQDYRDPLDHRVIPHRGASGYVPEHSLAAYQIGMDLKGGYIEPDLALTSDLKLVAMHDITLDETTDVKDHPEFADRLKNKTVTLDDDVHGVQAGSFLEDNICRKETWKN